jgi:hypothetical protein
MISGHVREARKRTKADPPRSAFVVIPAVLAEACNQHVDDLNVPL